MAKAKSAPRRDAKFPPAIPQFLKANTGLDSEQWDNIMKLVNKPEQDSLEWDKSYGYCENIGDKRGYTIGIFGATTGGRRDLRPDAPALFKAFDAASGSANPSISGGLARAGVHGSMHDAILRIHDSENVFCRHVGKLQRNGAWRAATWRTFYERYIRYSVKQARLRRFNSALTIGSFVDTALNQGAEGGRGTLQWVLSRSGRSPNEKTFLMSFYRQRAKVVDTNCYNQPPNGANRVEQWRKLLKMGQMSLKDADNAIAEATRWTLVEGEC